MHEQGYSPSESDKNAPMMPGGYEDQTGEDMSNSDKEMQDKSKSQSDKEMQDKKKGDNIALLNEIYQSCMMGKQAISTIIPKADDQNFKDDLINCYNDYDEICNKAATEIMKMGERPREKNPLTKAMMWGTLNVSTAIDNRTACLADVVVKGHHSSINNMTRAMNQYSENMDSHVRQLADEFIQKEQDNMQSFQKYL
jgi:hypothetical protein